MLIRNDRFFSFFALALIGCDKPRDVERDGWVDERAMPGIYVDEFSAAQRRVREVGDILAHSVKKYFGQDEEVDTWVKSLGGMRKLDELLIGREKLKEYVRDLKEVKSVTGFIPSALGAPMQDIGVESATSYDSYAVAAHRDNITKDAHGEREEDESTERDWSGHDGSLKSEWIGGVQRTTKPFWWSNIYMGRFRVGKQVTGENGLIQLPTSSGQDWVLDIRVSESIGSKRFKHITEFANIKGMSPWAEMEDHPLVKELISRFYNNPSSLTWNRVGTGDMQRWAAGMETPQGNWMWTPLTHSSSKSMDWWRENEGKEGERFYCRALYLGEWIYAYRKAGKEEINVRKFKACDQTGWLAKWRDEDVHFSVWGDIKKRLLRLGAKDAYFGKPGKAAEYKQQTTSYAQL